MVAKLMKFEYKSSLGKIGTLWLGLLACSVVFGGVSRLITVMRGDEDILFLGLLQGLVTLLFGVMMVVVTVTAVTTVIVRFREGMLGDEAYLMHTLPVTMRQLIVSKGLVATTVIIVTLVAIALASFIATVLSGLSSFQCNINFSGFGQNVLMTICVIVLVIVKILGEIYKVYASMAIAQTSDDHRTIKALGAYIGLNIAMSMLAVFMGFGGFKMGLMSILTRFSEMSQTTQNFTMLVGLIAVCAVELLIYHIIVESILKKKLNLL